METIIAELLLEECVGGLELKLSRISRLERETLHCYTKFPACTAILASKKPLASSSPASVECLFCGAPVRVWQGGVEMLLRFLRHCNFSLPGGDDPYYSTT
jgi:hypothetical protein